VTEVCASSGDKDHITAHAIESVDNRLEKIHTERIHDEERSDARILSPVHFYPELEGSVDLMDHYIFITPGILLLAAVKGIF
jgi:hypothetical protein